MITPREATDNADSWMFDSTVPLPPGIANRTVLQGQIVWSGLQDGYSDAGASDSASPYATLYWLLGEVKTDHCSDCPDLALGSPYDPPWAGAGSNQLTQSPGDGQTECGAACKCSLSYEYPTGTAAAELGKAIAAKWNDFLPTGYDSAGELVTKSVPSVSFPKQGAALTAEQKAALDDFRNSADAWDVVRRNLPEMPDMFGAEDLPSPLPAWDALTPEQQAIVQRIEEAWDRWGNAVARLAPPPVFLPDPLEVLRQWGAAAARGEFTPWWSDYVEPPSESQINQEWVKWLTTRDWPDPHLPDQHQELEAWTAWVQEHYDELKAEAKLSQDFRGSELEQPTIKLYNPNHDGKGRFTYGSGAKTTVARGQGRTRRGAGGKREANPRHQGASFRSVGTGGSPSYDELKQTFDAGNKQERASQSKARIAKDLANRMSDNKDFQAMADEQGKTPEQMASTLVRSWAQGSQSPYAVAQQLATKDEFGLHDSPLTTSGSRLAKGQDLYATHPEAFRGFARAQYDATQDYFAKNGIETVTLYRGMSFKSEASAPAGIHWGSGRAEGETDVGLHPLSSFSFSSGIAGIMFTGAFSGGGNYALTMSADVPVGRILSTAMTGFGCKSEAEMVVLGGISHVHYHAYFK
jgi:hypothetical protein